MNKYRLIVSKDKPNIRIDKYINQEIPELTRALVQKYINSGYIKVNNKNIKNNYLIKTNDIININTPEESKKEIKAENIKLNIIYEDNDLLIINKPSGMVVHPGAGNYSGTLVNAILHYCGKDNLSQLNNDDIRPGIVHRLDKYTSGLLLIAKNNYTHMHVANQLKERSLLRKYIAIVYGGFKNTSATINAPIIRHKVDRKRMTIATIGGREAITHFEVIEDLRDFSYIQCRLQTGRTHQIRVHMKYIGHPIVGDLIYGPKKDKFNLPGYALHANKIGFIHPRNKKYLEFNANPPEYFYNLLKKLSRR